MATPLMTKLDLGSISNTNSNDIKKENLHYVVAVDRSNCSRHALRWADFIANKEDKITIVHCKESDEELKIVNDRYTKYPKNNESRFSLNILNNSSYTINNQIMHYVNAGQKQNVDILVTGYYGESFETNHIANKNKSVGSTSDLSLRRARCSSMFVKSNVCIPNKQNDLVILVGVDGSNNSLNSFKMATKILEKNNQMFIVHIKTDHNNNNDIPPQYISENVIKNYTKLSNDIIKNNPNLNLKITIKLIENKIKIADTLCKFAKENNCHILFVGADGMTAHCNQKPIIGSVSDECVKKSPCNIIVTQINDYDSTPRSHHASPKLTAQTAKEY